MTVIEKSISIPVKKRMHIEFNFPQDIPPGEMNVQINITFRPNISIGEIIKKNRDNFKDCAAFQCDSVELVRKIRDGDD
ncbi:MAG: hypothetical protein LBR79_03815 [Oscillospiraceae bacterium]|jgi:hypothetical protein|nr:hypothetical protein [Oscillospiraceae bacterium]